VGRRRLGTWAGMTGAKLRKMGSDGQGWREKPIAQHRLVLGRGFGRVAKKPIAWYRLAGGAVSRIRAKNRLPSIGWRWGALIVMVAVLWSRPGVVRKAGLEPARGLPAGT
jgi:hypothetical protein